MELREIKLNDNKKRKKKDKRKFVDLMSEGILSSSKSERIRVYNASEKKDEYYCKSSK